MTPHPIAFDYYYGNQAEQFAFYRIPKRLFTDPSFAQLSSGAKILYGLMLDRMSLSLKNNWKDANDRIFNYFTLSEVQELMNCGNNKGVKILAELDAEKGIGLIERIKQGMGKPTRIYVKNFVGMESIETPNSPEPKDIQDEEVKTSEKGKSRVLEKGSQEFSKKEVKTSQKRKQLILILTKLRRTRLKLSISIHLSIHQRPSSNLNI
jgi:hypothetical protein